MFLSVCMLLKIQPERWKKRGHIRQTVNYPNSVKCVRTDISGAKGAGLTW